MTPFMNRNTDLTPFMNGLYETAFQSPRCGRCRAQHTDLLDPGQEFHRSKPSVRAMPHRLDGTANPGTSSLKARGADDAGPGGVSV